jgi:type I restriction enzyme M protein
LPNIFDNPADNLDSVRRTARSAASEARLAGELVRPLEDPVWRAEWSYPYHIASLARQYRIASAPESRKEACLKLGEGIARILRVLSLAILIGRRGSFSSDLRRKFHVGATFGTWLKLIELVSAEGPVHELPELERTRDPGGVYEQLEKLHSFRNFSGHAHGVRSRDEVQNEVDQLEPVLLSSLDAVGWLSGLRWSLVEQCRYTANGYLLVGERLRGSNPDWEPFQQLVTSPFVPERIYAEGPSSNTSIDLWPVASVELCQEDNCHIRELFLLDSIERQTLILRSLREHSIRLQLT